MTVVENLTPRVQYNYTIAQQQYPITFPYIERQYVKCMVGDELLVYNIDYQVPAFDQESLDDNELYLTLLITPTVGDIITIYRETPLDQQAEFPQEAKFSSQKITEALDKLTHQQQEQQDDLATCLRLSKNIPVDFNTELPAPAANQVIQWNEDGTQLINYDLRGEIQAIDTKADTAISTANTAESKADTAISTANAASTSASNAVSTANDAVSTANTANTNASNAVTTANTAESKADSAISTANTASTNASNAVTTANGANTTANTALGKANQAIETANTASTNASTAVSTANTASTDASDALSIANTASTNASAAVTTANTASSTAVTAKNTADAASAKVDEFGEDIEVVIEAAQSISDLDTKVATATAAATTATNASNTATTAAATATNKAQLASDKADIATQKAQEAIDAVASVGQSDWNQSDDTKSDYIKNKPTIPDAQIQSDWGQTDIDAKDYIKNKPNLATVATSGSYNDLSNKPTIPTNNNQLTNGAGYITGINSSDVTTALGYTPYNSTNPSGFITSSALSPYELIAKSMTTLSASGTLTLADNSVYKLSATGTITFSLPSISDTTKFHQILVQLYMASAQTINLGTTYYFEGEAPDMSEAGYYNIIYEYDNTRSGWVVGVIKKASAT